MKLITGSFILLLFVACSPQRFINKEVTESLLKNASLQNAHVGISLYDPAEKKYLYNYQGEKFFVPASNTKIVTCYAAMKYLGDSLTGIRYRRYGNDLLLMPTGDPTFLHSDYLNQPVINFLRSADRPLMITGENWKENALGAGWSWGDYNASYMVERSPLPVYGNVLHWVQENSDGSTVENDFEKTPFIYSIPEMNWKVRFNTDSSRRNFYVQRDRDENVFHITQGNEKLKEQDVPFVTHGLQSALELLADTVGKPIKSFEEHVADAVGRAGKREIALAPMGRIESVKSQPTDSVLKPMMHRSDNFFAEQTLLMVSEARLGVMDMDKIIDTLLKSDLADLPHMPRWADGSGLSRFNLFSPQDFVMILQKMEQEFGMDRIKEVFPTGGRGTLSSYYKQDSAYIYAKTGSLSGVLALSGFLYTKKNKKLIFSVLVNNHNGNATAIRRQVESFLVNIRNRY